MDNRDVIYRVRGAFGALAKRAKDQSVPEEQRTWSRKPEAFDGLNPSDYIALREFDTEAVDALRVFTFDEVYGSPENPKTVRAWDEFAEEFVVEHHLRKDRDKYGTFSDDPDQLTMFVIDATKQGYGHILVNTDGHTYIRYGVRLEGYDPTARFRATAKPVSLEVPGDMLLDLTKCLLANHMVSASGIDPERSEQIVEFLRSSAPDVITEERLNYDG